MKTLKGKQTKKMLAGLAIALLGSCTHVDHTPGPDGYPGDVYFGVDYEDYVPYSYWDNNESIPLDPMLGAYYPTYAGLYHFEYFINEEEYWYGTYELYRNLGGPGGSHGEHGYDGLDSYLMLICDPYGYHEHRMDHKTMPAYDQPLVVEKKVGDKNYRITIQKANVKDRPAQTPKFRRE